ncbi:ATP-binding protein [Dactylosporangium sp. CA-139066]|uniref:ATP-binding protein n=1 Tax=Dactylosporangium sp. CA-139066 TaxID=3239930 RepID=UPI003D89DD40
MSGDELVCGYEPDLPVAVLRAAGPLTLSSVAGLRRAALKALTDRPELLVLDVSGLEAVDDIALTVFPALARQAAEDGVDVMLAAAGAVLREQLERLAVTRQVRLLPSVEQARDEHARRTGPLRAETELLPAPGATARARALVDGACARWDLAPLADTAALVVTELVANAVEHAGTQIRVAVALRERHLHLAVHDASPLPVRRSGDPDEDDPGRGLLIVEGLASSWGWMPTGEGKVVWATLRRPSTR